MRQAEPVDGPHPERVHAVRRYAFDDTWIREEGRRIVRVVPVAGTPELATAFAATADDREQLKTFVTSYGRLGYLSARAQDDFVSHIRGLHMGYGSRPESDPFDALPRMAQPLTDPIDWTQAHARTVDWALRATQAVQQRDRRLCRRLLTDGPALPYARLALITPAWFSDERPGDDPVGALADHVARLVTDHTRAIRRDFVADARGAVRVTIHAPALLNTIYLVIGESLTGGARLATCQHCHRVFVQTHGSQKHCPKRFAETRSACLNRGSVRKWRSDPANRKREREARQARRRKEQTPPPKHPRAARHVPR